MVSAESLKRSLFGMLASLECHVTAEYLVLQIIAEFCNVLHNVSVCDIHVPSLIIFHGRSFQLLDIVHNQ